MADLDVTDLMDDPDLVSCFKVTRGAETVDGHGRTKITPATPIPQEVWGVVLPISARTMNMMPDAINVSGAIEIWSKYRLEGPSQTTQADTVLWQGNTYLVANVQSLTNFGRGFVHAVCQLKDLLAAPPTRIVSTR